MTIARAGSFARGVGRVVFRSRQDFDIRARRHPSPGGAVAQLGERRNRTAEVRGSNPLGSTSQYNALRDHMRGTEPPRKPRASIRLDFGGHAMRLHSMRNLPVFLLAGL